jgi:regulator of replication initiation timing
VEAEVEAPSDEDLPDKYKGKSASDIARMHQELEKRLGQQSSEVGELRRHFDEYVQSNVQAQQSAPEVVEEVDFFADPNAAMAKAIENHPTLKQAQAVAAEMAKSQALAKLKASHPDMSDVLQDEGFRDWVSGSPIRRELYQKADAQYDFAAADELITLYKERQGVVKQTAKVEKQHQKNEVKRASTGTARSNPEGATSKKIYRRRDIIELMNSDPKRYEALLPEIMKAYAEKRVK